jgi:DNA-directed RNA polymerase subunit K/omega
MSRTLKRYDEYLEAEKKIRIGSIFITRYERARIVGARALQLAFQASSFMDIPRNLTDPLEIAALELEEKCLPITIKRTLPDGNTQMVPVSILINERY